MTSSGGAMLGAALALGCVAWSAPAAAQAGRPVGEAAPASTLRATIVYTAPTSGTWGPSPTALPTHAFGKPAQVLQVVTGGYVVQQEAPIEEAMVHATYVSQQLGQPVTVTIPDPAGGPPRVESIGRSSGDVGK
jgi:hypothetical protein